jgi:hypothetical protein
VTTPALLEDRRPCSCGLLSPLRWIWTEHETLWGWPDWLLEHSPEVCVRAVLPDGSVLHGPTMLYEDR